MLTSLRDIWFNSLSAFRFSPLHDALSSRSTSWPAGCCVASIEPCPWPSGPTSERSSGWVTPPLVLLSLVQPQSVIGLQSEFLSYVGKICAPHVLIRRLLAVVGKPTESYSGSSMFLVPKTE